MAGHPVPQQAQQGVVQLGRNARHVYQRWHLWEAGKHTGRIRKRNKGPDLAESQVQAGDTEGLCPTCPAGCAWPFW